MTPPAAQSQPVAVKPDVQRPAASNTPITIPADFPLKAEIGDAATMVDFETSESLLAYPHLGKFSLYRPRTYDAAIAAGTTTLELQTAAGSSSLDVRRAVEHGLSFRPLLETEIMMPRPSARSTETSVQVEPMSSRMPNFHSATNTPVMNSR